MSFIPEYEVKATGHVVAKFKLPATPENIAQLAEWLKREKWRGALIANFPGNGGIADMQFAETPKVLREDGG
jgi:hypothetical protein